MLWIKAEATVGQSIRDVANEAIVLARRVGVGVELEFNGVGLHIGPGDCPGRVEADYSRRLAAVHRRGEP